MHNEMLKTKVIQGNFRNAVICDQDRRDTGWSAHRRWCCCTDQGYGLDPGLHDFSKPHIHLYSKFVVQIKDRSEHLKKEY